MLVDFHVTCGKMSLEEATRAASLRGYRAIAVNPGPSVCDAASLRALRKRACDCSVYAGIEVVVAVKLVHITPCLIPAAIERARQNGAQLVLGYGETIAPRKTPVPEGTNLAAIEGGVDILLHPGLITPEEAALAAERGVALELSLHPRHGLANGHLYALAAQTGATIVFGSNAKKGSDFLSLEQVRKTAKGAGMTEDDIRTSLMHSHRIIQRAFGAPDVP